MMLRWKTVIRWKYVIPRFVLLGIFMSAVYLGLDAMFHQVIVRGGQAVLGARVELGHLDSSLLRGRLRLDQLVLANPDSPRKNLLEAGQVELDVEMGAALRRKLIVREGRVSGLKFHTDRETDGTLDTSPDDEDDEAGGVSSIFKEAGERGEAWLNDSLDKLELEVENELHTVRVSRELKQRWPAEYERLSQRGKEVEQRVRRLRDQVKLIADDPLKHLEQVQPTLAAVEQLRRDAVDLQREMQQLQRQMQEDRTALQQAKDHDVQYVKERLQLDQLDGNSLTEYLLGPVWSQRIDTAVRWIRRTRELVPSQPEPTLGQEGISVIFPGFPRHPDVLIRQLHLDGGGTVEGKPYQFSGVLRHLTHQPWRYPEPARLTIAAEGAIAMQVAAVMDRRDHQPVDEYKVELPAVRQHGQRLGDTDRFAVEISPGIARVNAHVWVRDTTLEGTIQLRQESLSLQPHLADKYAKYLSPANLQEAVSGVRHLQADVALSGTLTRPRYRLTSNLGPELASGVNRALRQELMQRQQQLIAKANSEVEQELDELQSQLQSKHGDLLKQLELGDEQLDMIKGQLMSKLGSPADLIGRGRKLLFK